MQKGNLKEVTLLFLKLGIIGFGGPAAHIAMMQNEVVRNRKWMTDEHFLDLVGATNLIPGPNSTEMAIHIGYERAGWKGLILAGLCFILPAVIITGTFAWLYKSYGTLPELQPFLYGIKAAIIAVIIMAIYPLAKKSLKSIELGLIGVAALVLCLLGFNEIHILFGAGIFAVLFALIKKALFNATTLKSFPLVLLQLPEVTTLNYKLFFIFLKIGAILYGSGYVLFAFLDVELVATGLLTRQQLVDAIAVGQFTPGPVFSAVTFVGYQINGWSGAILSTIAIFLPSFVFVAALNPLVRKMRNSTLFAIFLDAVNITSVAIIIAVCYSLGKDSMTDWRAVVIGLTSFALLIRFKKINSAIIVAGGSLVGFLLSFI